jgi:hypothetical protein
MVNRYAMEAYIFEGMSSGNRNYRKDMTRIYEQKNMKKGCSGRLILNDY